MNPNVRALSSQSMKAPTVPDPSLPAVPRRLRLVEPHPLAGEVLDFHVGNPYAASIHGRYVIVSVGDYVGWRAIISFEFILTNPHLWVKVEEPFQHH